MNYSKQQRHQSQCINLFKMNVRFWSWTAKWFSQPIKTKFPNFIWTQSLSLNVSPARLDNVNSPLFISPNPFSLCPALSLHYVHSRPRHQLWSQSSSSNWVHWLENSWLTFSIGSMLKLVDPQHLPIRLALVLASNVQYVLSPSPSSLTANFAFGFLFNLFDLLLLHFRC